MKTMHDNVSQTPRLEGATKRLEKMKQKLAPFKTKRRTSMPFTAGEWRPSECRKRPRNRASRLLSTGEWH
jgi:hypothetical protein